MRILLLTQWYPPEPMKQLSDMAESLRSLGHSVEVLTGFPNWPEGRIYPGYRIRPRQREYIGGVPITRVPLFPDHSRSPIRRIANFASFAASASCLGGFLVRAPDVIHVIQPPTTCLPGWLLSRIWSVPFTYEVQDMWPETLQATGMVPPGVIINAVGHYCMRMYNEAAAVRVITRGFERNLLEKGVAASKLHYIPNWVDVDYYCPRPRDAGLAARLGAEGKFVVVYAGTIGPAQKLDVLLQAAELLRDRQNIQFIVAGEGLDQQRLRDEAQRRKLSSVKFLGRRPMSEMPALYAIADALLVHLADDPLFRITVPHKILTYLASGRPVLAAVAGDAAELIDQARAGLSCAPNSAPALARAVESFAAMSQTDREACGARGRALAEKEFERSKIVTQLASFLQDAVDTFPRRRRRVSGSPDT